MAAGVDGDGVRERALINTAVAAAVAVVATLAFGMASAPEAHAAKCKRASAPAYAVSAKQARKATLCLLNVQRRKHDLRPLRKRKSARKAARRHTRVMLRKNCFAHQCGGEPDLTRRISRAGYLDGCGCSWSIGENIAWGSGERSSPRKIVKAWMHSSGHRANILNRRFEHIGIGIKRGSPGGSRAAATYTTTFGARS